MDTAQTGTETNTQTDTNTDKRTDTQTNTQTDTNTDTHTDTQTSTQTDTKTDTPTNTQTNTQTDTNTDTQTDTRTNTQTDTKTNTTDTKTNTTDAIASNTQTKSGAAPNEPENEPQNEPATNELKSMFGEDFKDSDSSDDSEMEIDEHKQKQKATAPTPTQTDQTNIKVETITKPLMRYSRRAQTKPTLVTHAPPALPTNAKLVLARLPKILAIETKPFVVEDFRNSAHADTHTHIPPMVARWRYARDSDNNLIKESNARLVKWSDGSLQLMIGKEALRVAEHPILQQQIYLLSDTQLPPKTTRIKTNQTASILRHF